jgi:carnosine N-methyltransferase
VIYYIETVRHCLETGGIWINHGPLLWHFESAPTPAQSKKSSAEALEQENGKVAHGGEGIGEPGSFELTDEEVKHLVEKNGFEILEARQSDTSGMLPPHVACSLLITEYLGYITSPNSMLQSVYRPSFWVARKIEGLNAA